MAPGPIQESCRGILSLDSATAGIAIVDSRRRVAPFLMCGAECGTRLRQQVSLSRSPVAIPPRADKHRVLDRKPCRKSVQGCLESFHLLVQVSKRGHSAA